MRRFAIIASLAVICTSLSVAARAQEGESVKVATFNAYLLSPIFRCANPNFLDCLGQIQLETGLWANAVADAILKDTSRFDIIAINEAWDPVAKDILVDRLRDDYPNIVREIDADLVQVRAAALLEIANKIGPDVVSAIYGVPIVKVNGEDSGLMLFANDKFEVMPLPDPLYQWGDELGEELDATAGDVAFTLFDKCGGFDCMSAKGAAMIRLRHKPSGRIYNVAWTHMQADNFAMGEHYPAERRAQFDQIQELIKATLAPLSESEVRQQRILLMGDLNVPILHMPVPSPPLSEWDSLFNDGNSYFTYPLYEAWAQTTSKADPGLTNYVDGERFDYILASPERYATGGIEGPICVQHMTVPVDFAALPSDHNMVHADLNRGFHHCHPQIAYEVKLQKFVSGGRPVDQQVINLEDGDDVTQIIAPGSMQWFHVLKEPGTYSIGTFADSADSEAVAFEVYLPTDLTTPVSRYYGDRRRILYNEREFKTETFVLPSEFYIRTHAYGVNYTGNYELLVRRHNCASKEEACPLQPGQTQSATLTKANSVFGEQNEAWFEFDVVGASSSGADQTITLMARNLPEGGNFSVEIEDFDDTSGGAAPPPLVSGTTHRFVSPMGPGSTGFLVIRQAQPTADNIVVSAQLDTNIRFVEFLALACEDETNPEFGSDEIFTRITIDGNTSRAPAAGEIEYDCDDTIDSENWAGTFGSASISFVDSIGLRIVEGDDATPNDPSRFQFLPPLGPNEQAREAKHRSQALRWDFESGKYFLTYILRMRTNEPVKP